MNFELLKRGCGSGSGGGASGDVELESTGFQLRHYLTMLLGETSVEQLFQGLSLRCAANQVLVACASFVDNAAGQIHNRVQERVRGATVLGLDVIHGIANAYIRIETEVHAISRLRSSRRACRRTETVDISLPRRI